MSESTDPTLDSKPARPGAPRWATAILLSTAVFTFGGLFGAAITLAAIRASTPARFDSAQFGAERVASRLSEELDLSTEQSQRIREIFRSQHDQLKAIRSETEPRVREVLDQTHNLVMSELSDEQRAGWDDRFEQIRRRMRAPGWDKPRASGARGFRDPSRIIERHDRNEDGKLGPDEISELWERLGLERFKRMDANADGLLDETEIRSAPEPSQAVPPASRPEQPEPDE